MQQDVTDERVDCINNRIDVEVDPEFTDELLDLQVSTTKERDGWMEQKDKVVPSRPRSVMSPYSEGKLDTYDDNFDDNPTDKETDWSTQYDDGVSSYQDPYVQSDGGGSDHYGYDDDIYDEHSVDQMAMTLHHQQQQLRQCRMELQYERHKREAVEQDVVLLSAIAGQLELDFNNVSQERDWWKQQGVIQRETVKHLSSHIVRLEELLDEQEKCIMSQQRREKEQQQVDAFSFPDTPPTIENKQSHRHGDKSKRHGNMNNSNKHSKGDKEPIVGDHHDNHRTDDLEKRRVQLEAIFEKLLQRLGTKNNPRICHDDEPITRNTTQLIDIDDSMLLFDDYEYDVEHQLSKTSSNVVSLNAPRQTAKQQQSMLDSSPLKCLPKDLKSFLDEIMPF